MLMQRYLKRYCDDELSEREKYILELMIKDFSTAKSMSHLVVHGDSTQFSELLTALMTVLRKEISLKLEHLSQGLRDSSSSGSLVDVSAQLISVLAKMILSKASQEIVEAANAKDGEKSGINLHQLFERLLRCYFLCRTKWYLNCHFHG
jgi:hypothetical protein